MLSGRIFPLELLACCHSKMFRNLFNNAYNTLCPPVYHHNVFMGIPGLGHRMYGLFYVCFIFLNLLAKTFDVI